MLHSTGINKRKYLLFILSFLPFSVLFGNYNYYSCSFLCCILTMPYEGNFWKLNSVQFVCYPFVNSGNKPSLYFFYVFTPHLGNIEASFSSSCFLLPPPHATPLPHPLGNKKREILIGVSLVNYTQITAKTK